VVVHWIWAGDGWLSAFNEDKFMGTGAIDFAGGGVVHLCGGVAAFCGAIFLGPRAGRFVDGKCMEMPAHSASLIVIGTFILWFGWYGFNPGSTLGISASGYAFIASKSAVTTTLSAAAGGITSAVYFHGIKGFYDLEEACNGILAGLVGVTAGCSVIEPWTSIVIGSVSCTIYIFGSWLMKKMQVDDPLNAVAVHGMGGMWGCIAVGLFACPQMMETTYGDTEHVGLFYHCVFSTKSNCPDKDATTLIIVQLVEVGAIVGWTGVTMSLCFGFLRLINMLRVSAATEEIGLDEAEHGGSAYNLSNLSIGKPAQEDDVPNDDDDDF